MNQPAPMPLSPRQLAARLTERFGSRIIESLPDDKHPRVHIQSPDWAEVARFLYAEPDLAMDWLACLTAVDYAAQERVAAVYDLRSSRHGHELAVKVLAPRTDPRIASVADLWPAADWYEREAYDLMGIWFHGHPDLRRILLPEDWTGHPLRKDYVFPRSYHGIPASTELDWQQRPNYPG